MDKYPYYIYPDILKFRDPLTNEDERDELRRKIAANIGDIAALRVILGIDPAEFLSFYPDMEKKEVSTFDTIDSFLSKFGNEKLPPLSVPICEKDSEPVTEAPAVRRNTTIAVKRENGGSTRREELSILIKNREYGEAMQIIKQLNLNNPEKNIYFADQIRFLRKLMLNEEHLKKQNVEKQ